MSLAGDFWLDQTGSVTIEFVTLVPFFMALFLFFIDASMLYMTYSDMLVTAGEISRKMSVGAIWNENEARDYAAERLSLSAGHYVIDANFRTDTVTIAVPIADAALSGWWLEPLVGKALYASSTTKREPLM